MQQALAKLSAISCGGAASSFPLSPLGARTEFGQMTTNMNNGHEQSLAD